MFLFLDISIVFCVYLIFLWTLKFFYLGHVKKSLHNTIRYKQQVNTLSDDLKVFESGDDVDGIERRMST